MRVVEGNDPEHVGEVGEAAGDGEIQAPIVRRQDVEQDPDDRACGEAVKEASALTPSIGRGGEGFRALWDRGCRGQNDGATPAPGEEDGQVAGEGKDALPILGEERRAAIRDEDVAFEVSRLQEDFIDQSEDKCEQFIRGDDVGGDEVGDFDKRAKEGEGEEEVPVHAVLGDVFGVVEAFDAVEADEAEDEQGN